MIDTRKRLFIILMACSVTITGISFIITDIEKEHVLKSKILLHAETAENAQSSYDVIVTELKKYEDQVEINISGDKITNNCETVTKTSPGIFSASTVYFPCGEKLEKDEYEWVAFAKIDINSINKEILIEMAEILKNDSIHLEVGVATNENVYMIALIWIFVAIGIGFAFSYLKISKEDVLEEIFTVMITILIGATPFLILGITHIFTFVNLLI